MIKARTKSLVDKTPQCSLNLREVRVSSIGRTSQIQTLKQTLMQNGNRYSEIQTPRHHYPRTEIISISPVEK